MVKIRKAYELGKFLGEQVLIRGWVSEIDESKRHMIIRDGTGYTRVVFDPDVYKGVPKVGRESIVLIEGIVLNVKDKNPLLNASSLKPLKFSVDYPPQELSEPENRHLYITNPKIIAINNIKNTVIKTIREYFDEKGYREIPFPTAITKIAPENPLTRFDIRFHDHLAYLTQSTKPYLEVAMKMYEKVWTLAHTYRKEKIISRKHLSEFTTIDIQEAFSDSEYMMNLLEDMFCVSVNTVVEENTQELETLERDISKLRVKPPLRKIGYEKARNIINRAYKTEKDKDLKMEWGRRFDSNEEDMLTAHYPFPFFVYGFPETSTPFYIKPDQENPKLSRFFGLYAHIAGNIATGGEVIDDYETIRERMIELRFPHEFWSWYADLRRSGYPENSTAGIGLERMLMYLTGSKNITDMVLFPRVYGQSPVP